MKIICEDTIWDEEPGCTVNVVNIVTEVLIEIFGKYGSHSVLLLKLYAY